MIIFSFFSFSLELVSVFYIILSYVHFAECQLFCSSNTERIVKNLRINEWKNAKKNEEKENETKEISRKKREIWEISIDHVLFQYSSLTYMRPLLSDWSNLLAKQKLFLKLFPFIQSLTLKALRGTQSLIPWISYRRVGTVVQSNNEEKIKGKRETNL